MDFQSAMETFAEAWVAANVKQESAVFNTAQSEPLELTTSRPERDGGGSGSGGDETGGGGVQEGGQSSPRQPSAASPQPPVPARADFEESQSQGRSLPVHCVVETVWSVAGARDSGHPPSLEVDSYVIIPVATLIQDLVSTALLRLGYSKDNAAAAKGSVVLRNWRPLALEKIAESPLMTVGDILGELTSLATLRIQIFRNRPNSLTEMKEKLLKLLLVQHHSILVASGCPLDETLVAQLVRPTSDEPCEETRRKFDAWWSVQTLRLGRPHPPWYSPPTHTAGGAAATATATGGPPTVAPGSLVSSGGPPSALSSQLKRPPPSDSPQLHPAIQMVQNQHPTPKTRMRTSFDPELELPKLQQWFMENQHPSRQQIQQFVRELNSLESRRGRKPLDVNNVVYWFKNARAAQKRAEIRNLPPALQYKLMLNGYHSNSQSPSEAGGGGGPGGGIKSPPGSLNQDSGAETMEPLLSPASPPPPPLVPPGGSGPHQPPQKSPPPLHHQDHETSGGEEMSSEQTGGGCPDSISDSTNNNNNHPMKDSDGEEDESGDEDDYKVVKTEGSGDLGGSGPGGGGGRPGFPIVPNSMFSHSIMYMSHYFPGGLPPGLTAADERRKRNRTFIDPVSEVPRLEQWFSLNTHPSHALILKYTDDLNQMPYRQKFPPLEPKNVQFWFKNRRAKCKRLKMSICESPGNSYLQPSYPYHPLSGEPYQAH